MALAKHIEKLETNIHNMQKVLMDFETFEKEIGKSQLIHLLSKHLAECDQSILGILLDTQLSTVEFTKRRQDINWDNPNL